MDLLLYVCSMCVCLCLFVMMLSLFCLLCVVVWLCGAYLFCLNVLDVPALFVFSLCCRSCPLYLSCVFDVCLCCIVVSCVCDCMQVSCCVRFGLPVVACVVLVCMPLLLCYVSLKTIECGLLLYPCCVRSVVAVCLICC